MVEGNQNVEARKIGIYQGQVWHTDMAIKAEFDVARLHELNRPNITLGKPFIVVGVGDARGISAVKAPQVNGETLTVEPGTGLPESRGHSYPAAGQSVGDAQPDVGDVAKFKRNRQLFTGSRRA